MLRFSKRKQAENSDEVRDEIPQGHETSDKELQASDQFHCISSSTTGRKKILLYDECYLSMWFTQTGDPGSPITLCHVSGRRL